MAEQARQSYVSPYGRARIEAALGNNAAAIQLLEQSFAVRDPDIVFLKVDPALDSLRTLSGFQKLLSMGNF